MALLNEEERQEVLDKARNEVGGLLLSGEEIDEVFLLENDYLALTNKRIIFVDNDPTKINVVVVSLSYYKILEVGLVKNNRVNIYTGEIVICTQNNSYTV
ncbi:MAG: PH domain-containing protein, partial [Clostridium sp.]